MVEAINNSVLGIQKASARVNNAAQRVVDPNQKSEPVEDIVDVKVSANAFKSNATVLERSARLQEDLLRILDETA